jgi:hypothetical protein
MYMMMPIVSSGQRVHVELTTLSAMLISDITRSSVLLCSCRVRGSQGSSIVSSAAVSSASAAGVLSASAVFSPTGNFSLIGMAVTAEDTIDVTFRLTKGPACPGSTTPALAPTVSLTRRNCDGSVRRGAAATTLEPASASCSGDGVFKASVIAPYLKGDACFGIVIRMADGVARMAIVRYL